MSKVWATVISIVLVVSLVFLMLGPKPAPHSRGDSYLVIKHTAEQQSETKAPPGDWLLIRRIPRP